MRVACLLVPDFQVAAELARRSELSGRPLVIGGLPHERKSVVSCSPEAASFGVTVGMSLRQARGLCPESVFLPSDEIYYSSTFARILDLLDSFSPRVEPEGFGVAYLDADGLGMLFGPEKELGARIVAAVEESTGLCPRVGIAAGKFVALQAATMAASGASLVVEEGEERGFLAPRLVEQLPCSAEMLRRLRLLGLRTLGQLAALPEGAMAEQFGIEGVGAYRLARGIDERPVVTRELPLSLEESLELDPPLDSSEALFTAAGELTQRLEARLQSGYLACSQVDLQLLSTAGAASASTLLHQPTASQELLLDAVKRLVDRVFTGSVAAPYGSGFDSRVEKPAIRRAGGYPPPLDDGQGGVAALPGGVLSGMASAISEVGRRGINPRPTSETPHAAIAGEMPHAAMEKGAPTGQRDVPVARAPYFSHLKPRELAQLLEDAESGIDSVGQGALPRRPLPATGAERAHPVMFSADRPGRSPSSGGGAERSALREWDGAGIHSHNAGWGVNPRRSTLDMVRRQGGGGSWVNAFPVSGQHCAAGVKPPPYKTGGLGLATAGISLIRITLSGFGGEQGEQMELFRSRARSLRRLKQALGTMEEQFGKGIVRSLEEVARERPVAVPLEVAVDSEGQPEAMRLRGRPEAVAALCNRWRVEEEWWRRERTRSYHRVISEEGNLCLLFRERVGDPSGTAAPSESKALSGAIASSVAKVPFGPVAPSGALAPSGLAAPSRTAPPARTAAPSRTEAPSCPAPPFASTSAALSRSGWFLERIYE